MKKIFQILYIFIFAILINNFATKDLFALDCSMPDSGDMCSFNSTMILKDNTVWVDYSNSCCRDTCLSTSGITFSATGDANENCYCPAGYEVNSTNDGCAACGNGTWASATMNNCNTCPTGYTNSNDGSDVDTIARSSQTDCYKNCTYNDCPIVDGTTTVGYFNTTSSTSYYSGAACACSTTVNSCIAGYHISGTTCISDSLSCTDSTIQALLSSPASGGNATWNNSTSTWTLTGCTAEITYTPVNGTSGTKTCNYNPTTGNYENTCTNFIVTACNGGYYYISGADCVAVSQGYYSVAPKGRAACTYGATTWDTSGLGGAITTADSITDCVMLKPYNASGTNATKFCNSSDCSGTEFTLPVNVHYYNP